MINVVFRSDDDSEIKRCSNIRWTILCETHKDSPDVVYMELSSDKGETIKIKLEDQSDLMDRISAMIGSGGSLGTNPDGSTYVHPIHAALVGKPDEDVELSFGDSFNISQIVSDNLGHVTEMNIKTITIPSEIVSSDKPGLVPKYSGTATMYLRDDGTWAVPHDTTYGEATQDTAGLMSSVDKIKLDGITSGANNYQHPRYTAFEGDPESDLVLNYGDTFSVTQVKTDNNGHVETMKDRSIKLPDSDASDTQHGLMKPEDKVKLENIEEGANKYVHPAYAPQSGDPISDQTPGFGDTFTVSQIESDGKGHVSSLIDRNVTIPNTLATSDNPGLMSTEDKTKLKGIAENANNYEHPTYSELTSLPNEDKIPAFGDSFGISQIVVDKEGHVSKMNRMSITIPGNEATSSMKGLMSASDKDKLDTVITSDATNMSSGYMSARDKEKLDTIDVSANNYTHPTYESQSSLDNNNLEPNFGDSISIPKIQSDDEGHVTSITNSQIKIPDSLVSQTSSGLMSSEDKIKLDGITGHTEYIHPSYNAYTSQPNGDQTPLFGESFKVSQLISDEFGHVSNVVERNITIPSFLATESDPGLMSAADKTKLDNLTDISEENTYTHPSYEAQLGTPQTNQEPSFGQTFEIGQVVSDDQGHVKQVNSKTVKIPDSIATKTSDGLMSSVDKTKLDNLEDNIQLATEITDGLMSSTDKVKLGTLSNDVATTESDGLMSSEDKIKLDTVSESANNYIHPTFDSQDGLPVLDQYPGFGETFRVAQTTSNNEGHVVGSTERKITIPNSTATETASGLMSFTDKSKLDGVAEGANKYVHPGYAARIGSPTTDQTPLFGTSFQVTQPETDNLGHVTEMNTRNIKIPDTIATTSTSGLMSATDKTKLDNIETQANKYVHPSYTALTGKPASAQTPGFGGVVTVSQVKSDSQGHVTGLTDRNITIPNSVASSSANGLMSAADKSKLDTVSENANNYTHPAYANKTGTPTADQSPSFGGSFYVNQVVSDATGHVTAMNSRKITIPSSAASSSANGLMSSSDKSKLDGIASGAQVNTLTGVKGNAESSYRTGNVNLTPANIGAIPTSAILSTLSNIASNTSSSNVAGALALKELKSALESGYACTTVQDFGGSTQQERYAYADFYNGMRLMMVYAILGSTSKYCKYRSPIIAGVPQYISYPHRGHMKFPLTFTNVPIVLPFFNDVKFQKRTITINVETVNMDGYYYNIKDGKMNCVVANGEYRYSSVITIALGRYK